MNGKNPTQKNDENFVENSLDTKSKKTAAKITLQILTRLPAPLIMIISFYLSSLEKIPMPDFSQADKYVHFVCFSGLAFWWTFYFNADFWKTPSKNPKKFWIQVLIVVAIVSVYGIADEIHQSFVPGRSCSILDWLSDTLGAFFGTMARTFFSILAKKTKMISI